MIRLVIPGPPPRKNEKTKVFVRRGKGHRKQATIGRTLSPEYKRFRDVVALTWDREKARHRLVPLDAGAWEATILAYWARQRHLDIDVGMGDADAPIECVLDALEDAGAIDDDSRIVRVIAVKLYDKANPRVVVELREVDGWPAQGSLDLQEDPYADF